MRIALLLAAAVLAAGCIGEGDPKVQTQSADQVLADELLGEAGSSKLADAASLIPKNYSFPAQALLPTVKLAFPGHVDASATGGYEGENDEGGIDYRTVVHTYDLAAQIPDGQPAEIVLKVFWDASEVNSADLDLVVDVPGNKTSHSPVSETLNWNYAVKTLVVNTVGVAGQPALVGVQIASGAVTTGFDYTLEVSIAYAKDVLTPYHPWAFHVPPGASGVFLESERAGGDEHIASQFIVVGPDDRLVAFVDFNDIDIPTQSVFIPVKQPGEHVFYAYHMHGGFFRIKADEFLTQPVARPLALVETRTVDASSVQPGRGGKDPLAGGLVGGGAVPKDDVNAAVIEFATSGTFPLRVTGFIEGTLTADSKITLSSPKGVVHALHRVATYRDADGTIGYTGDQENGPNHEVHWENIEAGAWTARIVNTSPDAQVGHLLLTYDRGAGSA